MSITKIRSLSLLFITTILHNSFIYAASINVGSFNVNSGRAHVNTIAKQLSDHNNIDIWGISESAEDWPSKIVSYFNSQNTKKIEAIKGSTGMNNNRLQIYYDPEKFTLISHTELDYINRNRRVRAPLVAHFKDVNTQQEFLFMINHLYRRDSEERIFQAAQLNKWAKKQNLPIIAVGDYNFDLSPTDITTHCRGFDELTKNNIFTWIQPNTLLPTQCSKYNSILDFIFVSDKLMYTSVNANISYTDTTYCNPENKYSDHRPVTAIITV